MNDTIRILLVIFAFMVSTVVKGVYSRTKRNHAINA